MPNIHGSGSSSSTSTSTDRGGLPCKNPNATTKAENNATVIDYSITVENSVAGVLAIVLGLIMVTAGYRLFRVTLFVAGALLGYIFCYAIIANYVDTTNVILVSVSLGVGVLCGLIVLCLVRVGLFAIGATAGFVFASWLLAWIHVAQIQSDVGRWVFLIGCSFVCGVLTLVLQKPLIVVCTAFFGSFFFFYGVDQFVDVGYAEAFENILANDTFVVDDNRIYYMVDI